MSDTADPSSDGIASLREADLHRRIYAIVRSIPPGRVATYGQVAAICGRCTPRMVGRALATLSDSEGDVPWQRVLNSAGRVSERTGGGSDGQRQRLLAEGVVFDHRGRVRLELVGWEGPGFGWIEAGGFFPAPTPGQRSRRR